VAWKRMLDPASASGTARFLMDLKGARAYHSGGVASSEAVGVRAVDPLTLSVELETPSVSFLHVLTMPALCAIPAHVYERHGQAWIDPAHVVTNGPFRLEAWRPNERIVMVRNPQYCGRSSGNVQRLEVDAVREWRWDDLLRRYENDEVDIALLAEWKVEEFRHRHAEEYITGPTALTEWLWMDSRRPPFKDRRVRQAFVHACDREAMVMQQLRGLDRPAAGGLIPFGLPGHQAGIGLAFDPDRARRLLAEAGYPGGEGFPEVEFITTGMVGEMPHMSYLCAQWKEVLGVQVGPVLVSLPEFERRMREAPPHLTHIGWLADYPDPDNFLRIGLGSYGDVHWNEEYADLVEAAGRSSDQRQRIALYEKADRLLIQEAAVMPLIYGRVDLLLKPRVRRYPLSPVGFWFWKDVVIEEGAG